MASVSNPPLAVHSIDKANVLATSRLWRATVTDIFKNEFPNIKLDHQLVDSAAMIIAANPRKMNGILLSKPHFSLQEASCTTILTPASLDYSRQPLR